MIKIIDLRSKNSNIRREDIIDNNQLEFEEVNSSVQDIVYDVKENGDKAVKEYTKRFDKVDIEDVIVTSNEIDNALKSVDKDFIDVLKEAKDNIWNYHSKQVKNSWITNADEGCTLGQIFNPIEKVGIYVPGGTAPYPSTVLMNAIPAKVAGVKQIIMTTPPQKNGTVDKNILAAAKISGVDLIIKAGGAQAIAALTFGTETIPKVNKIVGPGNIYVAVAKKLVYGHVDIDMIAGPSEILILADKNGDAEYIAADMLSQAEHDELASSVFVTTSVALAKKVNEELPKQIEKLSRKDIIKKSIKDFGRIIIVDNIQKGIDISNEIAPEHLEIMVEQPLKIVNKIKNAGAIFLGKYSPEPLGDYWAGPNHTLPTSGTAKFFSPLSVDDFVKKSSLIYYDRNSLLHAKDKIINFAKKEGLTAHANSIKVRF